jgi:N-acetylglucosaminyldiphosphoundecaprenol N-acetyl-beta-D-mannosaminyltransferase
MAKILGVRLDTLDKRDILATVEQWFLTAKTHTLYTPNPEMLVDASRNRSFQNILNRSDLNIADGFGVSLMSGGTIHRIPGIDLMQEICQLAEKAGQSIYLVGAGEGVAKKATDHLRAHFPNLLILGSSTGPMISREPTCHVQTSSQQVDEAVIEEITRLHPSVVFVAFGHEKQEWWIDTHKTFFPDVRLMMGVGGSFDFLAGRVVRAPKVFSIIGIEWLWRLIQEPRRIGRIVKATIIFPILVLYSYLSKKEPQQ